MQRFYIIQSYRCNNKCSLCVNTKEEREKIEPYRNDEVIDFLKQCNEKEAIREGDVIELSGGEPTINQGIVDLCKGIKEEFPQLKLALMSNSRKFGNKDFAEKISPYTDHVITSFFSINPEIHDYITQVNGSFEEAYKGLKNMEDLGVCVSVKSVATKQNYKELSEFVDFAIDNFSKNAIIYIAGLDIRKDAYIWDTLNEFDVPFSEMAPYIEKAIYRAKERDRFIFTIGFPMCTMDPACWNNYGTGMVEIAHSLRILTKGEQRFEGTWLPDECHEKCLLQNRCFWSWEDYLEKHGKKELNIIDESYLFKE